MRFVMPAVIALTFTGAAFAQPAPRVTIEDDVEAGKALTCAATRAAQVDVAKSQGVAPNPLLQARQEAWVKSGGVSAQKAKEEGAKLSGLSSAALAVIAKDCEPFEIQSAG
jgi:hypothetical protein